MTFYFHIQSNYPKYTILLKSTVEMPDLYIWAKLASNNENANLKTDKHFGTVTVFYEKCIMQSNSRLQKNGIRR